jgi:hypothetical protein
MRIVAVSIAVAVSLGACSGTESSAPGSSGPQNTDSGAVGDANSNNGDGGNAGSDSGTGQLPKFGMSHPTGPTPNLTPGVWTNITPMGVSLAPGCCPSGFNGNTFGITSVEIDTSNPATLYVTADVEGIWRSTDAGSTWTRLGTPPASPDYDTTVSYLDSALQTRVDPNDPKHLYAIQGVRGSTLGFWVSTDGGTTWSKPPGFIDTEKTATNDISIFAVDPTDFKHVLLGAHSPWATAPAGILETKDGGQTFTQHPSWSGWNGAAGTMGIDFIYQPTLGIGSAQTWLASRDSDNVWRTTDSGTTWTQVSTLGAVHGGVGTLYYSKTGALYSGANHQMIRSTDQGLTWTAVGPSFPDGYYQVIGDGNLLYAQESNTGANTVGPQSYITSSESDGVTWTPYQSGTQTFTDGPYMMRFDPVDRIIYSANWDAGLWALKVK